MLVKIAEYTLDRFFGQPNVPRTKSRITIILMMIRIILFALVGLVILDNLGINV